MHLFSKSKRFFGGNAIVAQGIPQSVGLSMASKRLNENRITASFFGEGAMAEGVFHEALNLSSLWHFPVLFCCENNLYAMGTALSRSQAQVDLIKKAQAHNVEAISVDGMDIIQVIDATRKGIEYMGREGKPFFIEFKTYRFRPHSMFDPDLYRKKEEINMWMKKDPLLTFENDLLNHKSIDPIDLIEMDKKVDLEMEEAVRFAQSSRPSSLSDLEKDVYENNL